MLFTRRKPSTYASARAPKPPVPPYQHTQPQSLLINLLPAEIRNEIYTHVFATDDGSIVSAAAAAASSSSSSSSPSSSPTSSGSSPHPLSLLLTCRRLYHEAAVLAFSTHTFPVSASFQPTYFALRAAVLHLPTLQLEAVGSLSVCSHSNAGSLLTNALLVFPRLRRFVIRTERERKLGPNCPFHYRYVDPVETETDVSLQAVERYAPYWFHRGVVEMVTSGRAYAWQEGSRWTAQWPQLESAPCYSLVEFDKNGVVREELHMDIDAVGVVPGVQACVYGCDNVLWTAAVLTQEGGRRVNIDILYCSEDEELPEKACTPEVFLVPGAAPSAELIVKEAGISYEAGEEYWEGMRRRNGNLGALSRELWRRAAWPVMSIGRKDTVDHESVASAAALDWH